LAAELRPNSLGELKRSPSISIRNRACPTSKGREREQGGKEGEGEGKGKEEERRGKYI